MPNDEIDKAKNLLTQMYVDIRINKKEKEEYFEEKVEKEKQSLKNLTILELIKFISNYIKSLLILKDKNSELFDEEFEDRNEEKPLYKQYEELLIKAESDIRKHIKVSFYIFYFKIFLY